MELSDPVGTGTLSGGVLFKTVGGDQNNEPKLCNPGGIVFGVAFIDDLRAVGDSTGSRSFSNCIPFIMSAQKSLSVFCLSTSFATC